MNVVDSSAWLEYFADGPNASVFAKPIESITELIVPTLAIYEVFKRVCAQRSEDDALRAVAQMEQGRVVDLDRATALAAARISLERQLPMADSIILATALEYQATLWTQDADFQAFTGVRYVAKRLGFGALLRAGTRWTARPRAQRCRSPTPVATSALGPSGEPNMTRSTTAPSGGDEPNRTLLVTAGRTSRPMRVRTPSALGRVPCADSANAASRRRGTRTMKWWAM